jgi:hypothetical protein
MVKQEPVYCRYCRGELKLDSIQYLLPMFENGVKVEIDDICENCSRARKEKYSNNVLKALRIWEIG